MGEAKARATRLIENQRMIVTEWLFGPGEATGFHVHQHDYVVVPLSTGKLRIVAQAVQPATSSWSRALPMPAMPASLTTS